MKGKDRDGLLPAPPSLTKTHSAKQKMEMVEKRDDKGDEQYHEGIQLEFLKTPLDVMASRKLSKSPKACLNPSLTDLEPLKEQISGDRVINE